MSESADADHGRAGEHTWQAVELVRRGGGGATESLPEQIAVQIALLIESGALGPGRRLPSERELARIFGVSRLAVREAAHRLEARGLVVVRRGAGSFVALESGARLEPATVVRPPTLDREEFFEVRMLLEPAAADWAARRTDRSSIGVLVRIAERFEEAVESGERRFDLFASSDVELHLEIARCADNALLAQLIEQLLDLHRLPLEWSLRRPERLEEATLEHRRLVDAIAAADPVGAREAMVEHLTSAAASFRELAGGEAVLD